MKSDFDRMGRTVKSSETVDSNTYTMAYQYNLGGQLTQETYPSGRIVNTGYDDAGRLATLNSGAGHVYADAFTYAGHGALSGFTLGNGATVSLGYGSNGRLQLSDITLAMNGTTLQKYAYSYGKIESGSVNTAKNTGQLAQVDSWIGTDQQYRQQYQYDSVGRLTDSTEKYGTSLASTAYDLKYSYDTFGNRFQKAADNTGNTAIAQKWVETGDIDPATNRFIATGATPTTYDASGNITADPKFRNLTYGYDANGRQNFAASSGGSGPSNAIYDAAGQRVANKVGGVLNLMVYDAGGKLVAEYGATAPGTANLQYITANYQGSTSVVTDAGGGIVSRHDYLPFGEEIGSGVGSRTMAKSFGVGDMARQRFAGMETDDATGMATTLWRKDDNLSGRWTSPDPYAESMSIDDPQSLNRYTYCNNDPVNDLDPLGLMAWSPRSTPYIWQGGLLMEDVDVAPDQQQDPPDSPHPATPPVQPKPGEPPAHPDDYTIPDANGGEDDVIVVNLRIVPTVTPIISDPGSTPKVAVAVALVLTTPEAAPAIPFIAVGVVGTAATAFGIYASIKIGYSAGQYLRNNWVNPFKGDPTGVINSIPHFPAPTSTVSQPIMSKGGKQNMKNEWNTAAQAAVGNDASAQLEYLKERYKTESPENRQKIKQAEKAMGKRHNKITKDD